MDKILQIDLVNKEDVFSKYNKNKISNDLIDYVIEATPKFRDSDNIKIVINNKIGKDENYKKLIIEGLKEECSKCRLLHHNNNLIQITYLILGIFIIFLSTIIDKSILKEIILIGGWVLIWEMIEIEIISDVKIFKRKRILNKLLKSEFVEKYNK